MLDMKFVRENPDVVKKNLKDKFQEEKLPLVDEVIELDKESRGAKQEADNQQTRHQVVVGVRVGHRVTWHPEIVLRTELLVVEGVIREEVLAVILGQTNSFQILWDAFARQMQRVGLLTVSDLSVSQPGLDSRILLGGCSILR